MKMQIMKRIQFLKLEKKVANDGYAMKLIPVQRKPILCCRSKSYVLKQLMWKLKSQWKQAMKMQRNTSRQFSYDLHSYSLNFDDGFCHDQQHITLNSIR
ncbi:hypothetical protein COLO4_10585 [Corchorus olitorius]|uniref:Uncharacterized protein n=1 Tax=Corchorus olitorius TaxID=93759 RepID=A0A1R3K809_9ROSI|nr:hypothetical protein COLO4_10585 [Corchorus olitorius]